MLLWGGRRWHGIGEQRGSAYVHWKSRKRGRRSYYSGLGEGLVATVSPNRQKPPPPPLNTGWEAPPPPELDGPLSSSMATLTWVRVGFGRRLLIGVNIAVN